MRYGRVIKTKRTFCYRLKKNIFAEKSGKSTITRRMLVPGKKVVYVHKRRNKSQISFISIHSRISKIKKKLRTFTVKKENLKKISKKYQINKLIKKNMNFLAKRNKINYKECGVILCFKENSMDDVSKKSGPASSSTIGISLNLRNGNSSHKLSPPTPQVSVDTQPFLTCDPSPPSIRISAKSPEKLLGKESRTFLDFSTPPDQIKFERNSRSSSVSSQDINSILSITIKEEWKKITSSPKKTKQIPIADFPRTRRSKELAAAQEVKQIEKVYQINEDHLVILHSLREPRIVLERIDSHPAYIKAMKDLFEEEENEEEEFVHPPEVCEDDPFGCPFCNRVYKREHHLKFHISTHFTKKELELEEPEIKEFKIGLFFL